MPDRTVRRPYEGPACPWCGSGLELPRLIAGGQVCPRCVRPFLATPFFPPEPRVQVEALAAAGPEGAVPCARHAGNAAVANCTRCGVFMCSLCRIEIDGQELCPSCFERLSSEGVLSTAQNRYRDFRGLSLSVGVLGCLVYFLGLLTGPVTIYLAYLGYRQRKQMNESGGIVSLVAAVLLGLSQIGLGLFLIYAVVAAQ